MTKVMMDINPLLRTIMFDCQSHADDHDACTIISALTNVLVEASMRAKASPTAYGKGHVRLDISGADDKTIYLFETVLEVMKQAADQQPDYIRIY